MIFACGVAGGPEEQVAAKPLSSPYDNSISLLRAVVLDGMKPDGLSSLETNMTVTEILDAAGVPRLKERRFVCQRRDDCAIPRTLLAPAHQLFLRCLLRAPESLRQSLQQIRCHQRMLAYTLAHHISGKSVQVNRRKHCCERILRVLRDHARR